MLRAEGYTINIRMRLYFRKSLVPKYRRYKLRD